jgi:hypothetical protein
MILSITVGVLLLIGLLLIKFIGGIIGASDGADDQNQLWWLLIIAQFLLPAVIFFFVFGVLSG